MPPGRNEINKDAENSGAGGKLVLLILGVVCLGISPALGDTLSLFPATPGDLLSWQTGIWTCWILTLIAGIVARRGWVLAGNYGLTGFYLYRIVAQVMVMGRVGTAGVVVGLLGCGVVWFLSCDPALRREFALTDKERQGEKMIAWAILTVLGVMIVLYSGTMVFLLKRSPGGFSRPVQISLSSAAGDYFLSGEGIAVGGWRIPRPAQAAVSLGGAQGEAGDRVILKSADESLTVMIGPYLPPWGDYAFLAGVAAGKDGYARLAHFYHQRIGLVPLVLRSVTFRQGGRLFEFEQDGARGFLTVNRHARGPGRGAGSERDSWVVYDYQVFDALDHGLSLTFIVRDDAFTAEETQSMVAGVRWVGPESPSLKGRQADEKK